jgi:hypothetical protein
MANTYSLIASNTLSTSAASVTFSAIPNTFTDLVVRVSARTDRAQTSDTTKMTINADNSAIYSFTKLRGDGTSALSNRNTGNTSLSVENTDGNTATSNTFDSTEIYIPNYLSTANKPISSIIMREDNSTAATTYNSVQAHLYRNTSAITSLSFAPSNGPNFVSGSSFFLYGIKNS